MPGRGLRIAAMTAGQMLLAAFVIWAAQQQSSPPNRLLSGISGLFKGSFQAECVDAVCNAEEVEELYESYRSEMIDENGTFAELVALAGGNWQGGFRSSGPIDAMLESFLSLGNAVRAQDVSSIQMLQDRNPASVLTFDGFQPSTGFLRQYTKPPGGMYSVLLGGLPNPPTSFLLGRTLMAQYSTGTQAGVVALRSASPGVAIQSLDLFDNVTVQSITADQVILQGDPRTVVGWYAKVVLGSATLETIQQQGDPSKGECNVPQQCATRQGAACPGSPLFFMRPVFQANTQCVADPKTCAPWGSIRPGQVMVNANYFSTCRDYYCASCAGIGGLSISPHYGRSTSPDSPDPDTGTPLGALLIYKNPLTASGSTVYAQIVPHESLPSDLSNVSSAVAGTLLTYNWQAVDPDCDNCHEPGTAEPRTIIGFAPANTSGSACPQLAGARDSLIVAVIQSGFQLTLGATASRAASFMANLCVRDALMLDGGGSSQFYYAPPWNPDAFNTGSQPVATKSPAGDLQIATQQAGYRPVPNVLIVNPYVPTRRFRKAK